jgi:hypothetical protein
MADGASSPDAQGRAVAWVGQTVANQGISPIRVCRACAACCETSIWAPGNGSLAAIYLLGHVEWAGLAHKPCVVAKKRYASPPDPHPVHNLRTLFPQANTARRVVFECALGQRAGACVENGFWKLSPPANYLASRHRKECRARRTARGRKIVAFSGPFTRNRSIKRS